MKYYYDFDMDKTFTTEQLKKEYEKHKNNYEYGDFDGFLEVEGQYMDEISEEVYKALNEKDIFYCLTAILMQELFENGLFDVQELADKYTMSIEQTKTLFDIYNTYFGE